MRREIVINAAFGETRAALLEDRNVVELFIERDDDMRVVGNIYKGRVENVLPGMQAAFVDIGLERNAFLYVDDAMALHRNDNGDEPAERMRAPSIKDILKKGQEILVQITKEALGTKGARVVTNLSLPGRYVVLMPTVDYIGISRRITDERERARLRSAAKRFRPKEMGLIIRTVAEGRSEEELRQDCLFLVGLWEKVQAKAKSVKAPALLYKDYDLVYRLVRDVFSADVDKMIIDDEATYKKTLELLESLAPPLRDRVFRYTDGPPIFEAYGIEDEIEKALDRRVWLDSGGYLVIDHSEALTAIDVNTGRFIGSTNLADTVLKTNLEAAGEIARQLRLRDIGGIIIIDFIDMESERDEALVLQRLQEATRADRTRTHILGFTQLGLVEMTRKKVKQDIENLLHRDCPYCKGSGQVLSEATVAFRTQREIKKRAQAHDEEAMLIHCHPAVAALIIGTGGSNLRRLEEEVDKAIYVKGVQDLHINDVRFVAMGAKREVEAKALPVREGQVLEIQVEEQHITNPHDGIARLSGYVVDIEGAGARVGDRLKVKITKVFRTYARARVL